MARTRFESQGRAKGGSNSAVCLPRLERWVYGVRDHEVYRERIGAERISHLGVKQRVYAAATNLGD